MMFSGFLGSFSGFFGTDEVVVVEEPVYNSQTIPVLEATANPLAEKAIGGAEIAVIDDALMAENSPVSSKDVVPMEVHTGKISTYVVQEGDTISQIAEMFGVSTNTIRWGNDINTKDIINPGDRLVILPINGVRHTVEKGETLASIAKKYEGDIDEIKRFNEFTDDIVLAVGDEVVIPNGEVRIEQSTVTSSVSATYSKVATSGYFAHPVPGAVRTQGLHGHNAVDFGAPIGTSIYASAAGEVIVSRSGGWNGGYGNYVVIKHGNGTQTLYSHMSSNEVYVGQYLEQGDLVGYIGITGKTTGPHLHFEIRGATNPF